MIPVVDVYLVLELTSRPDSDAISFDEEHDVDDDEDEHSYILTRSAPDSVEKDENEREISEPPSAAMTQ